MRIISLFLVGLALSCPSFAADVAPASAAEGVPQLRGLLSADGERLFSLVSAGRATSQWVKLGATFDGWELADFKPAEEALILKKGTRTVVVKMEGSAIGNAAGGASKATLADAEEVFRKMDFDRMIGRVLDQQKTAMVNMTRQMTPAGTNPADREAAEGLQKKMMDAMFEAMNLAEMKNDMVKAYSETFTHDELRGLSEFYSTPAGQAMVEKQPEVSEKINALMMPRLMAAIPKIQAMGREFATEQMAKKKAAAGESKTQLAVPPPAEK